MYKVADGEMLYELSNRLGFNDMVITDVGDRWLNMLGIFTYSRVIWFLLETTRKSTCIRRESRDSDASLTSREKITIDANTQYRLRTVVLMKSADVDSTLIVTGSSDGYIQVGL